MIHFDRPQGAKFFLTTLTTLTTLATLACLLILSACSEENSSTDATESGKTMPSDDGGNQNANWRPNYQGPDHSNYATTPAEQQALQAEIDAKNLTGVREHGWELWGALTHLTDEIYDPGQKACGVSHKLAAFDTWYGEEEIFRTPVLCPDGKPCAVGSIPSHYWHTPRQAGGAEVLSFNKYSAEFVEWVDENKLYDPVTLTNWNEQLTKDAVPTTDRTVDHFIDPPQPVATMLKPTFWVLKKDQPMMIPYWVGPLNPVSTDNSDTPRHPIAQTWKNFVLYDPTGKADPTQAREVTIYGLNGPETHMVVPKKVVTQEDFYALPLTAEDVKFIQGGNIFTIGGVPVSELEPCDIAVLVGMHVTSAEVRNWTWQTFYWNPFPSDPSQPTVEGSFRNFDMATAYFFDGSDGKPHIAYNPYLEPPITGPTFMNPMTMYGADSNCMTCHHAAAFPTINGSSNPGAMLQGSYVSKGPITGSEQWLNNRIQTTFMWGLVMSMQSKTGPDSDEEAPKQ